MTSPLPFENKSFSLKAGSKEYTFICPADEDAVLDAIPPELYEREKFLPYWAEHWPVSEVLFDVMAAEVFPENARACDLGCGLGTVASMLARRGLMVVGLDISPDACQYALANARRQDAITAPVCADWRRPPFREKFDVIVCADILYEKQCIEPVFAFLCTQLKSGGCAYIADPGRNHWEEFKKQLAGAGFDCAVIKKAIVNNGKTNAEILKAIYKVN